MLKCRATVSLGKEASKGAVGILLPLRAADEIVAVMSVAPAEYRGISGDDRRLLDTLAELAAVAIGRQLLADRLAQLGIEQEADRLRSALLDSIAHDLTAPISSVASALTTLNNDYPTLEDATRRGARSSAKRNAKHNACIGFPPISLIYRGLRPARSGCSASALILVIWWAVPWRGRAIC
jgi:K+-sensing histidine kinase KdpD